MLSEGRRNGAPTWSGNNSFDPDSDPDPDGGSVPGERADAWVGGYPLMHPIDGAPLFFVVLFGVGIAIGIGIVPHPAITPTDFRISKLTRMLSLTSLTTAQREG